MMAKQWFESLQSATEELLYDVCGFVRYNCGDLNKLRGINTEE